MIDVVVCLTLGEVYRDDGSVLVQAGVPVRHMEETRSDGTAKTVPMYSTNIQTTPVGPFHGEFQRLVAISWDFVAIVLS